VLQHAWAAAVETVGTFIQQALKSSQGEAEWLRFFALMGSAIALREKCPPVPDTPTNERELVDELREHNRELDVEGRLTAYQAALSIPRHLGMRGARYYLLQLDPVGRTIKVTGYKLGELEEASRDYSSVERTIRDKPGPDAVLVSVESIAALRRAYPNYFLDTRAFLNEVRRVVS
jgi:hypothetical protein